jgi:hypothetical protein
VAMSASRGHDALPVCLGGENPHRLVSLWDIVNQFKASDFCVRVGNLAVHEAEFIAANPAQVEEWADLKTRFTDQIVYVMRECKEIGLQNALDEIDRISSGLAYNANDSAAHATAARQIRHCLTAQLRKRQFLYVSQDNGGYVDQRAIFGEDVNRAFPSAAFDIRESGNCLAAECSTAAMFHLMRAVEWALRALCVDLGFRRVRRKNKKTGKVTYTPLGWSDWETLLNQLKCRVTEVIAGTKRGPKKQLYQEFYYPALQDIEGMKDAWRNHVMHTRREYTPGDAQAVFGYVRRLMTNLASRISEGA